MNQQTISLSKTRVVRLLILAFPMGVLLLTQACAPRRYGESPKSTPVAASEIAPSVENHSFKK